MRKYKVLQSLLMIVGGWFLIGFGYATKLGHPVSTICFIGGLGLFFTGIAMFIVNVRN